MSIAIPTPTEAQKCVDDNYCAMVDRSLENFKRHLQHSDFLYVFMRTGKHGIDFRVQDDVIKELNKAGWKVKRNYDMMGWSYNITPAKNREEQP